MTKGASLDLACCEIDDEFPFGKAPNATISCFTNFDVQVVLIWEPFNVTPSN